jgi:multiple antibiotic resistance protein
MEQNVAVYPLAVPSIASPGAMMTVVVLTDNNRFSVPEQSLTSLMMVLVLAATFILLLLANPIHKVIRASGASIVSRVMGMILAAVAVDIVLEGLELRFLQP